MPNAPVMSRTVLSETYLRHGLILDYQKLTVDLSEPRTVLVHGVNSKTGETKDYLLKVTQSGKLLLI